MQRVTVRTKVWFEVEGKFAIGEGGLQLLRSIRLYGSLTRAAAHVGWSYRHAWGYVRRAEAVLGTPLLVVRNGKGARRGATLTLAAEELVAAMEQLSTAESGWIRAKSGTPKASPRRLKPSTRP